MTCDIKNIPNMINDFSFQLSASNMQMTIITALENASALYPDNQNFVPQSVLWQRIAEPEGGTPLEGEARESKYSCFLSALCGKKNSLALFESQEDPETDDVMWRQRPQTPESAAMYLTKGDKHILRQEEQQQQIAELQRTLSQLRRQAIKLEADNSQYALLIERMKRSTPPDIQKSFDFYETLYGLIDQFGHSLKDVEKQILDIGGKIPAFESPSSD